MQDYTLLVSTFVGLLAAFYLVSNAIKAGIARSKLNAIPTIGPSGILTSYIGAYRFFFNARGIIQDGYDKYYGTAFKIPKVSKWMVVVSGPRMVDDIRKAADDQLSFREAVSETIQSDYTIGPEVQRDPYHVAVVRSPLTRNLGVRFSDVQDEIATAFEDIVPARQEWTTVPALKTIMKIVCRTSNRLFVGLPLCRNKDYLVLNEQYTIDVMKWSHIINVFPNIFKPIAARLFTNVEPTIRRAMGHIEPIIRDRLHKEELHGGPDWPGKPNDLISWLLQELQEKPRSVRDMTLRVLVVNFAAIHTTSMALTQALYDLAVHSSHVPALREEVESVINSEGLNKSAIGKMRKLDSFIKESQRLSGTGALIMDRKVLKDFTFSDGTVVPAGNTISVASFSTHNDESNYFKPQVFDGFRFAEMREVEGESIKHQMVSLSLDYVAFGIGRHACPGRFFAVNELKAMLAHVLLTYDVKLEKEGIRPDNQWFESQTVPNPSASIMFRKRAA